MTLEFIATLKQTNKQKNLHLNQDWKIFAFIVF